MLKGQGNDGKGGIIPIILCKYAYRSGYTTYCVMTEVQAWTSLHNW